MGTLIEQTVILKNIGRRGYLHHGGDLDVIVPLRGYVHGLLRGRVNSSCTHLVRGRACCPPAATNSVSG